MRTRMLGLSALSAIAAEALFVEGARADVPLTLSWIAPSTCPSRDVVLAEVERLLAARAATSSRVTASATITKNGGEYRLRMVIAGASGERNRVLDAATCGELSDAAALILAIAINPSAAAPIDAPSTPPASPAATHAPAAPSVAPVPRPVDTSIVAAPKRATPIASPPPRSMAPREPDALRAVATVGADQGTFVGATPSLRAGVAFVAAPLRIELAGLFTWGGRIAAPSAAPSGAEMWRAGGSVSACLDRPLPASDATRAAICAGFEACAIHATSYGITAPDSATAPWLAPTIGGLVRWPVGPKIALRFDLGVAVPIVEAAFRIQGVGLVHRVGAVAGRGGIGIEVDIF